MLWPTICAHSQHRFSILSVQVLSIERTSELLYVHKERRRRRRNACWDIHTSHVWSGPGPSKDASLGGRVHRIGTGTVDAHKYVRTQVHKCLCLVSTVVMNFAETEVSEETHADNYHTERILVICQSKVREACSCTLKRFLFRRVWTREEKHAKKIQLPTQAELWDVCAWRLTCTTTWPTRPRFLYHFSNAWLIIVSRFWSGEDRSLLIAASVEARRRILISSF